MYDQFIVVFGLDSKKIWPVISFKNKEMAQGLFTIA